VLLEAVLLRLLRPIRDKPSGYLRFAALATKPGEKSRLAETLRRQRVEDLEATALVRKVMAEVIIRDDGPGLPESGNLFVPFFTTKKDGSGIGLFLSRQIAEAHGGSVTVVNRGDHPGCEAVLRIPLAEG
jgi:signal transduction histidine kinase